MDLDTPVTSTAASPPVHRLRQPTGTFYTPRQPRGSPSHALRGPSARLRHVPGPTRAPPTNPTSNIDTGRRAWFEGLGCSMAAS
ncbi:hypothetical protein DXG01_005611, partial [Tephrocybe rancida]